MTAEIMVSSVFAALTYCFLIFSLSVGDLICFYNKYTKKRSFGSFWYFYRIYKLEVRRIGEVQCVVVTSYSLYRRELVERRGKVHSCYLGKKLIE